MIQFGIPVADVMQRLQQLKEDAFQEQIRLRGANPNWDSDTDARLKALINFYTVIELTQFKVLIVVKLADDEWCAVNLDNEFQQPEGFKNVLISRFESSTRYDFGMAMFTIIEKYFRDFLRSLDPIIFNNSTGPFENIYSYLLSSNQLDYPADQKAAALSLLNFVRLIRNLIHNDGVYYSKNGQDTSETYRNLRYEFYNGRPVNFVTWNLLLMVVEDILKLLKEVINHPKIVAQDRIVDPFAAYNR